MLVHRELVAMGVDEPGDVVTGGLEGQRKGSRRRVDSRKRCVVAIHGDEFVVSGDRDNATLGHGAHRTLRAQVLEVRVGIFGDTGIAEEVDRAVVRHDVSACPIVVTLANTMPRR